jgi:FkbM family methyltransferase
MISLADLLGAECPVIEIVDVGALEVQGLPCTYAALLRRPGLARVTGFEPAPGACERLNARGEPGRRYLPYFIGDGSDGVFRVCDPPMTSSLYEPDLELCSRFFHLAELNRVVKRIPVKTTRLDDVAEITRIDYLKMDIQGGELNALIGGRERLRTALVVDVEVEFVPLYKGQPLFADVDRELRAQGFVFHCFSGGGMSGRTFKPLPHPLSGTGAYRQVLWADAVYVRDFMALDRLAVEDLLRLAFVVNDVYGSHDLAAFALQEVDRRDGGDRCRRFMRAYMSAFTRWYNCQEIARAQAEGREPRLESVPEI